MKRILFMHTGSGNHGCEAIVRSTSNIIKGSQEIVLWSYTKSEDEKYGVSELVDEIVVSEQIKKGSVAYFEALFRRKILRDPDANLKVFLRKLFKNNIAISIGGDNYCYEWSAKQAIDLDHEIRKYCKYSILWACSIDPEAITEEMKEDLSKFDLITARESITYELLKGINKNTIKVADPAFLLEKKEKTLPKGFVENNTVGINISPLILQYGSDANIILKNYEKLIQYILNDTDMNICLIPHVVWEYNNDMEPIELLYNKFKSTGRICKIEDGNCCELKGYIARCRFFIGARTHATIAAYSSYVPTLVVGYSVKSRGIARDLFGTDQNYVIPVQNLRNETDVMKSFKWLYEHETVIKEHLSDVLPNYIQTAYVDLNKFFELIH